MELTGRTAIVTGAGSGIGLAIATELSQAGMNVGMVDRADGVKALAATLPHAVPFVGDVTDMAFRASVFDQLTVKYGLPSLLVPAAGITKDRLAVTLDKETKRASLYNPEHFRLVLGVNLEAPTYWALELMGRVAETRAAAGLKKWSYAEGIQAAIVFIGSVAGRGNVGQVSYSATKAAIVAVAATLTKEGMFHGVRAAVVHPGFTNTPMVAGIPADYLQNKVLPTIQQRRLLEPVEIARTVAFAAANDAITGELVVDAGWFPLAS